MYETVSVITNWSIRLKLVNRQGRQKSYRFFRFEATESGKCLLVSVNGDGSAPGITWVQGEGWFTYHKQDLTDDIVSHHKYRMIEKC
jgi:hypothetical protein